MIVLVRLGSTATTELAQYALLTERHGLFSEQWASELVYRGVGIEVVRQAVAGGDG